MDRFVRERDSLSPLEDRLLENVVHGGSVVEIFQTE